MRIGFLGLGIMGTPMAANLLKAGLPVSVWNRTPGKTEPLTALGAKELDSPSQITEESDVTFAMVSNPTAALETALGPGGAVDGLSPGKCYVDCSTVDPLTAVTVGDAVRARGAKFLEAPVSGSKKPAEDGQLIFLAGGDREAFDFVSPFLSVMGKSAHYLGETGNGARMKLVVNMIMGVMCVALSEGLNLAGKTGLDPETLLKVLDEGAIQNPMFRLKGPNMLSGSHAPAFPLTHMQKDLRLALQLADSAMSRTPAAAAANQLFLEAMAMGLSEMDFAAVNEAVRGPRK